MKEIEFLNGINYIPSYKIICPACKNKLILSKDIAKTITALYCHYCKEKIK